MKEGEKKKEEGRGRKIKGRRELRKLSLTVLCTTVGHAFITAIH